MRRIKGRLGLLASTLAVSPMCLLGQDPEISAIEVVVSDLSGAGISQAQIEVVPHPEKSPQKVKTDDKGHASLRLMSGEYALGISAQGFMTSAQTVRVSNRGEDDGAKQIVKVILKIGATGSPTVIYPPDSFVLVGDPYRSPVVLSLAEFRALPDITIKVHNGHTNSEESYSGVLLASLLAKVNAPVGKEFHKEALSNYVGVRS